VPFRVGETLTYDVSWSEYLVAGTAVTMIKDKKPALDSTAYELVTEARSTPPLSSFYPVSYRLDSMLDAVTLLPQHGSFSTAERNRNRLKTTRFDRAARKAFFEDQATTTTRSEFPVAANTLDALSTIYVLRTLPLENGRRVTIPVTDDGTTYTLTIDGGRAEPVKTPLGEIGAWKTTPVLIDGKGQPVGRNLTLWFSTDAHRYPLKMQVELPVGRFVLLLREAR
jgi:hypothetical protein